MIHLEKKGALGLFRRVDHRGARVVLEIGRAGEDLLRVRVDCTSEAQARRTAGKWVRGALDTGYDLYPVGNHLPGVVAMLESPKGPGRIRIDRGDDVYFEVEAAESAKFKVGKRVLISRPFRRQGRKIEYMFGSPFQTKKVAAFPKAEEKGEKKSSIAAKQTAALQKQFAPWVLGHEKRAKALSKVSAGDLILAYEKGIHRFLKMGTSQGVRGVFYEPVLTSAFKRQTGPVLFCVSEFCEPAPKKLVMALRKAGI